MSISRQSWLCYGVKTDLTFEEDVPQPFTGIPHGIAGMTGTEFIAAIPESVQKVADSHEDIAGTFAVPEAPAKWREQFALRFPGATPAWYVASWIS